MNPACCMPPDTPKQTAWPEHRLVQAATLVPSAGAVQVKAGHHAECKLAPLSLQLHQWRSHLCNAAALTGHGLRAEQSSCAVPASWSLAGQGRPLRTVHSESLRSSVCMCVSTGRTCATRKRWQDTAWGLSRAAALSPPAGGVQARDP